MKRQKVLWMKWFLGIALLIFLLSGTASSQPQASPSKVEGMLTAAGFKALPVNNPKRQAILQKVPPRQLVPHQKGQKMLYVYADPETKVLYVGDDAAKQRFINEAVLKKLEERHRTVATPSSDPEFWSMWEDSQGGG